MRCGVSAWLRRAPAWAVLGSLSLSGGPWGCAYTSEYTAPQDGRARALWRDNNVVFDPSGAALSEVCAQEMMYLTATGKLRLPPEYRIAGERSYWTPRYYGSPIVVLDPGLAPVLPLPPLFLPSLGIAHSAPLPAVLSGGAGISGGGGGGDKGLAYLAVIVLLVLPAVDLGLALSRPESETKSSQAIDQANAYNDLARSPGSPCFFNLATAAPVVPDALPVPEPISAPELAPGGSL